LAEYYINNSTINKIINKRKTKKRVKISYEYYKAKTTDIKVDRSLGSEKRVEGEKRIVNEKGDSKREEYQKLL
jgi:hypothetical protein